MLQTYTYSGNDYASVAAGTTTFALTSTSGNAITYLQRAHIHVYLSTDSGASWTEQARPADWDFNAEGTSVVLKTGIQAGECVRVRRITPILNRFVDFADGSLLTAAQLDQGEDYSRYCDQELQDAVSEIDGSVVGNAVKQVIGDEPIQVDASNLQAPVVSIDETDSTGDPNVLTSDTRVMSEKAIDEAFKQYVGALPASAKKLGQFRIDNTGGTPALFYWEANASTPAWVEIGTAGPPGPPGPVTPVDVDPNTVTGPPGSDAAVENTGTNTDAKFKFTIPRGEPGIQGPPGPDGPPGSGVDYKGPIDPTQPNSEPSNPSNGDFYVSTASGATTWTGLTNVLDGTRLIWNASASKWDAFTPVGNTDLAWIAAPDKGTIFNSVGTDATVPLVDGTNAGLMSPGQKGELDTALQPGDNISELNNDSGFITAAEVPATGVTSVNGDTGPAVVLDAADVGALPDTTSLNFVPLGSWASIPALT